MTNDIVLLHGGTMGPWCWEPTQRALERSGMRVVAPVLPLDDPKAGFSACIEAAVRSLPADSHAPLVVAHSASGSYLPLAATALSARKMVFLCATIPLAGMSWNEQLSEDPACFIPSPAAPTTDEQGRLTFSPESARGTFFADCSPDQQEWAVRRLVPFAQGVPNEKFPIGGFDGAPPAEYILGTRDRILSPEWHRRVAQERLRCPCIEIETGHSPFLADPEALAGILGAL